MSHLTEEQADLITKCLTLDPHKRSSIEGLLACPIFDEVRSEQCEKYKQPERINVKIDNYRYATEEEPNSDLTVHKLKKYIIKYAKKINAKDFK